MANSEVSPLGIVTAAKANEITIGDDEPSNAVKGQLWMDTALNGTRKPVLKVWTTFGTDRFIPYAPVTYVFAVTGSPYQSFGSDAAISGITFVVLQAGVRYLFEAKISCNAGATFKDMAIRLNASGGSTISMVGGYSVGYGDAIHNAFVADVAGADVRFSGGNYHGTAGDINEIQCQAVVDCSVGGNYSWFVDVNGAEANNPNISAGIFKVTAFVSEWGNDS